MPPRPSQTFSTASPFRVFVALLLAAGTAGACGSGTSGPTKTEAAGTYFLQKVSGTAIPYTLVDSIGERLDLTSGFILLSPIGHYSLKLTTIATYADSVDTLTSSDYGVWGVSGANIQFVSDAGGSYTAAVDSAASYLRLDFPTPDTTLVLQFEK